MYWTNFRQPTAHVQQNIFGKTLIEVCSPHLYASFGTFCVQIGQLFEAQWVFKVFWKSTISCLRRKMSSISEFFRMFKDSLWREWLTNLDAKGAKRSVKMWTTNFYKSFSKNILLYMSSRLSKIRSVHTYYVCYAPDGLFWLNLYAELRKNSNGNWI